MTLNVILTLCLVNSSTTIGQNMPLSVPQPLLIPIKIEAYLGAMSRWFTLNPESWNKIFHINWNSNKIKFVVI